jgi:cellobiose phosphorylase
MYRLVTESLLGLRREGRRLSFAPCIAPDWPGFGLRYREGATVYDVQVRQEPGAIPQLRVDGVVQDTLAIMLDDRGGLVRVDLLLPTREGGAADASPADAAAIPPPESSP